MKKFALALVVSVLSTGSVRASQFMSADVMAVNQSEGTLLLQPAGEPFSVLMDARGVMPHLDQFSKARGEAPIYDVVEGDRLSVWHSGETIIKMRVVDIERVRYVANASKIQAWEREQERKRREAEDREQDLLDRAAAREAKLNQSTRPINLTLEDNRQGDFFDNRKPQK